MRFQSKFELTDYLHIDGDKSIKAAITGILFFDELAPPNYELTWIVDGVPQTSWVKEFRLTRIGT